MPRTAQAPWNLVDRSDLVPLWPHREGQLHEVYDKGTGVPLGQGRTLTNLCPHCHKILGFAQRPVVVGPVVDEAFLTEQVDRISIPESGGAFMVAVVAADWEVAYAAKGSDPDGNPPTPGSAFRVGSITKAFTSLVTLSLVDEGLVDLDAPAVDSVTRVPVPKNVSVRDLLQPTSGIPEFFNDPSLETWLADPSRMWTPEETVELIAGLEPVFEPGSEWHWAIRTPITSCSAC